MGLHASRRWLVAGLWAVVVSGCGGGGGGSEPAASPAARKLTIAVIPKGTTHEFWKSIHAGALKAAGELSRDGRVVEIIWKGPLREDDREQQVQVVESFTSQGVDGIILAPLDANALVRPVEEARRLKIPTVIFDSGLASQEIVSYVATDNFKGGELAAERLGSLLGGKGKALLLRYQEGSASTEERERGFETKLKSAHPGVQLVSSDQYSGPTRDTAKRASENLLNRFGAQVQGIFTPNESSSMGMLLALQDEGRAGKLPFVGFDASPAFVEAMRKGQMHGIVLQNPYNMGYLALKTMVEHLEGKQVPKVVDTGVELITPDNLDAPRSQELLNPPQAGS
jgi:ribose transport system substrate-binding protein